MSAHSSSICVGVKLIYFPALYVSAWKWQGGHSLPALGVKGLRRKRGEENKADIQRRREEWWRWNTFLAADYILGFLLFPESFCPWMAVVAMNVILDEQTPIYSTSRTPAF